MEHVVLARDRLRPGDVQRVAVEGRALALVCTSSGELFALRDVCPHQQAPLSEGILERMVDGQDPTDIRVTNQEILRCPWHQYEFDLATGCSLGDPERLRVKSYPVFVRNGEVVIRM
jgi:nitrite reductase (NADH) small subunit